ncbi:MAG TPA: HEAT repeat domain-containing protein [Gemmatimonadaceae bacterium]|nr:HEAT repeat domain-containing protein [Gemmatimonadaceae bacterium]
MDQSATFARHFARLVSLLISEPTNVAEQKVTLRVLVTLARAGGVRLEMRQGTIVANDEAISPLLPGVTDLRERMTALGMRAVEFDAGAAAADVLGAARQLADVPRGTVGETVRMVSATPPAPVAVQPAAVQPPAAPAPKPVPKPAATPPVVPAADGLFEHFVAARPAAGTPAALFETFDAATGAPLLARLLDELVRTAESAVRDGDHALVSEIFHRIVARERQVHDADARRSFMLTIRRLSRGAVLRAVAQGLVRAPGKREEQLAVLARTGEDGADALIEQLAAADERSDRRIYFDALLELRAGVPTLLHMLGDPRWFVARNAAVLLGELGSPDAEQPLSELLHHDDERVRHAATIALMRLGTPRSMPAIEQALRDSAPQIRIQAAVMLVERRGDASPAPLLGALDAEKDDEVRASFYQALGHFATPEAVEKLITAAQPERGLFRRKPVPLRIAAIQALAVAGTPQALDALVALQADRDSEVQQAAVEALEKKVRDVGKNQDVGRSDGQEAGDHRTF